MIEHYISLSFALLIFILLCLFLTMAFRKMRKMKEKIVMLETMIELKSQLIETYKLLVEKQTQLTEIQEQKRK